MEYESSSLVSESEMFLEIYKSDYSDIRIFPHEKPVKKDLIVDDF